MVLGFRSGQGPVQIGLVGTILLMANQHQISTKSAPPSVVFHWVFGFRLSTNRVESVILKP